MNNELIHSDPPHIHTKKTITGIRINVLIALMPAVIMSSLTYYGKTIFIVLVSLAAAVITDLVCDFIFRRKTEIMELEAAIIGVIFALMLPYYIPLWVAAAGAAIAVIVFKQVIGLMGRSYIHPAAGAYLVMSCLLMVKPPFVILLGCICADIAPALIAGLIYLLIRRIISWHIPLLYILVYVFAMIATMPVPQLIDSELFGLLLLTAIFIAPTYASSPATPKGKVFFGIAGGVIACALSLVLSYEISLALSIIIINILSPMIERLTIPKSWRYSK